MLSFRANLTGGKEKGQSVPCDPNKEDCQAAGHLCGYCCVSGGTDRCLEPGVGPWRSSKQDLELLTEAPGTLTGERAHSSLFHLLSKDGFGEGEPWLVPPRKVDLSGRAVVALGILPSPSCTPGLLHGLFRRLTAVVSLWTFKKMAGCQQALCRWWRDVLASLLPLRGQHHQTHGACGRNPEGLRLNHTLLQSAQNWGKKGRGCVWQWREVSFVTDSKEQFCECKQRGLHLRKGFGEFLSQLFLS